MSCETDVFGLANVRVGGRCQTKGEAEENKSRNKTKDSNEKKLDIKTKKKEKKVTLFAHTLSRTTP
jgi:hypothetical protein